MHLKNNYRSTKKIVEAANKVIKNNSNNLNQDSIAVSEIDGDVIIKRPLTKLHQADMVASTILELIDQGYTYNDIKILYRNRLSSRQIETVLNKYKIPNFVHGMRFLEYKEIQLLINYLEFMINHDDNEALEAIINNPSRGIGNVTVCDIRLKAMVKNISMFEACKLLAETNKKVKAFLDVVSDIDEHRYRYGYPTDIIKYIIENYIDLESITKDNKSFQTRNENLRQFMELAEYEVKTNSDLNMREFLNSLYMKDSEATKDGVVDLMTIHQSKGLEAKIIIIVDLIDKIIPGNRNGVDIEEERRVFYVGLTRAKDKCYLIAPYAESENSIRDLPESRFIDEIKR